MGGRLVMSGTAAVARASPQVGHSPRSNEGDAEEHAPATGLLTLSRPQNGVVATFDAEEYAVIDFMMIDNQWTALVQLGRTLKIVFKDGSIIELLNFFSYSSAYDAPSSEDHTSAVPGDAVEPLLRTSAGQMLSSEEFAQTYWITKTSGAVEQAPDVAIGRQALDTSPLPILPDLSQPIFSLDVPPPPQMVVPPQSPLVVPPLPTSSVPPTVGNRPAVITGPVIGTVIEAGGVNNGTPGTPTATGDLHASDVDNPSDAWTAVGVATASASGYGTYTLTAKGVWTYTLDNNNAAVQALNVGQTLADTFKATTVDGTAQLVTITINGANDAALIVGPAIGTVLEAGGVANGMPGTPTATGDLNSTDVDNPNDAWTPVATTTPGTNGYGSYTLTAAGIWTYTLDNSNAAVQALNVGDTLTDTFTVATVDGTAQLVTIIINGANDAAVITGATTGSVIEAGGVANGSPGTANTTGHLNSTDVDNPDDAWDVVATSLRGDSSYGTYTLTAAGVWTYTLDNSNATVQALNAGQTLTDSFTAFTVDGTAQLVTITINGANDAAVITGTAAGTVIEAGGVNNGTPGIPTATGDLTAADVDNPTDAWTEVGTPTASASGFGSYTLTADGIWTYSLDNTNAAVQALNAGDILIDSFTVTTVDGTAQLVTVTINGANDAAVITGAMTGSVTEAGGVNNGTPGIPTATGDLISTDVDNPNDAWAAVSTATASGSGYGAYTLTAAGLWVYTLNNSNAAVQALNVGDTLTDTFTAFTVDGTAQLVTVTIHGANDAAVVTGTAAGSVLEAGGVNNGTPGTPTATGDLNSTDVDNPNDAWTVLSAPTASANGYGSYTLTAAGSWVYTLNNSNATVQALNAGDTLTDTFTVATVDGTAQVVTITIDGANDTAVITGVTSGSVTEAGGVANGIPGTPIATGDLNSTDVDNPNDAWDVVTTSLRGASGFGSYTLTASGVWTYTLDNSNPTVQALNVGDTLTDTFTAFTVDGTAQLVTVTIHGANDAAVITGATTGSVTEAGGVANGIPGTPIATGDLTSTDVDNPPDDWTPVVTAAPGANGYGSYTLTAAGVWAYTLDNSNAAVQALNVGDTLTDTFTVSTVDGTSQLVTITINGANDAAVISGATTGSVTEAGGVANGTPGTPTATGDLNAADVDNPSDAWSAVSLPTAGASGYGSYTLTSTGGLELYARQQQRRGAGAQRRRHADRHLHRLHGRRHRATRHRHHPWRQRRRRDQRDHGRRRDRGRWRQQRNARHPGRDR